MNRPPLSPETQPAPNPPKGNTMDQHQRTELVYRQGWGWVERPVEPEPAG